MSYIVKKSFFFFGINLIAKVFLIKWSWVSYFTKYNKDTNHTNGIYIHTHKTDCPDLPRGWPRTESQINTSPPKGSSTSNTHHNQLAKCPNDTVCSQNVLNIKYKSKYFVPKREVSRADTRRLTRSWSFQKNLCVLPRKNVSWQSMPSRRETRRTLEINSFGSCYECFPKSPSRDQRAKSREGSSKALPSHLTALSWPQSCLGMQETAISREHRGAT